MVSVATGLDLPIKILWPRSIFPGGAPGYSMLGLGDIVMPGAIIALGLRYDYHRSSGLASFNKPYFYAGLASYVLGLGTTMFVMHKFQAAQPALLYLRYARLVCGERRILLIRKDCSPACILSSVITALARGEMSEIQRWSDEPEEKVEEKKASGSE